MCFLKALGLSLWVPSLERTCVQSWNPSFSNERKCLGKTSLFSSTFEDFICPLVILRIHSWKFNTFSKHMVTFTCLDMHLAVLR